MKWLRYCIVVLSFIMFSPASLAGQDPIGWKVSGPGVPSTTVASLLYPAPILTYTFINNMPFKMVSPLYINKITNPNTGEFTFPVDTCSGVALDPGQTCVVTVNFVPNSFGQRSFTIREEYGRNVVPLPTVTTNVTAGNNPLVTGTVTIPLPATMAEGATAPFQFTFTNNNNGTVTNVTSPVGNVTINPNPGGTGTLSGVTTTCAGPTTLAPGATCVVSGNFTAGIAGSYTVNDFINYNGGSGVTNLSTSTTASQQVTGAATTPLPTTMGAGERQPFVFTYTNNGSLPIVIPAASTNVTSTGGTTSGIVDNCSSSTLAPNGGTCTVSGQFNSLTPGSYSVTSVLTLPGGATVSVTTTSTGSILVTGAVTQPLPANMGAGEADTVQFTWTNNGTGTIYGISTPTVVSQSGGTLSSPGGTCTTVTTLAPGASCIFTGTFTSGPPSSNVSLTVGFNYAGGTNVVQQTTTSNSTTLVVGSATTPIPSNMGAGEQQSFVITYRNTGSGTVAIPASSVTATASGGTISGTGGTCNAGVTLAAAGQPGDSCTFTGTFNSGAPAGYTVTTTLTYPGGVVPVTMNSTGTIRVAGIISPGLPSTIGTGEAHTVIATFTNSGTGTIYDIVDPTTSGTNVVTNGGSCGSLSTTCGTTLGGTSNPPNSCTVTCTNFMANVPGTASVSFSLTYAGGTTATVTTQATAAVDVVANTLIPLPSTVVSGDAYPVEFAFTNNGAASVSGSVTAPTIQASPGTPASTVSATTNSGSCTGTLGSGSSCTASATFTPNSATTSYIVYATYTYTGGNVVAQTTGATAFARKLTLNNYCGTDVWYAFSGAPVRNGCSDKNPCPNGSVCSPAADGGKGVCYWKSPIVSKGSLHLGAMTGMKPSTAIVLVPDLDPKNGTIWSGSIAGRTGCVGKACETADCNSGGGDKSCPAGNTFAAPATTAQFILMRNAEDRYSIQAGNGINLTMSMGPTNPEKTTPAYNANAPYYCATPGSADASRIFNACSCILKPPANTDAGTSAGYPWVKAGKGGACSADTCAYGEVCGLSYNAGKFARVCGKQLGFWTASQACLLNSASAGTFFDCNAAMKQPSGELLKDLNTCTNAKPGSGVQPAACTGAGNAQKATLVQWIKSACPSVSAFPGDTANSSFTCATNKPVIDLKKNKVNMNVTEYTISFCPELAPNSPFRNLHK